MSNPRGSSAVGAYPEFSYLQFPVGIGGCASLKGPTESRKKSLSLKPTDLAVSDYCF